MTIEVVQAARACADGTGGKLGELLRVIRRLSDHVVELSDLDPAVAATGEKLVSKAKFLVDAETQFIATIYMHLAGLAPGEGTRILLACAGNLSG